MQNLAGKNNGIPYFYQELQPRNNAPFCSDKFAQENSLSLIYQYMSEFMKTVFKTLHQNSGHVFSKCT